jgi:lipoprotein-anchoring transpeptidase ErfK/SrfK
VTFRGRLGAVTLGGVKVRGVRLLLVLPLAAVLAGCAGTAHPAAGERPPTTPKAASRQPSQPSRVSTAPRCATGIRPVGSSRLAVAAVVRTGAVAYRRPGARPFARFGRLNVNRFPTVLRVLSAVRARDCRAHWYRVQLPIKPNGVTGYVRATAVATGHVRSRVLVDLSARRLTLFRNGRRVLRTTVAVGSPATPTPTGRYYVNQRLIPADASGPFGPAAIGISAYSTVLTGWTQGGPIAIHGTNEPWSIGHAVSNGCIRVSNAVLRRLFRVTPAGTPVLIRR